MPVSTIEWIGDASGHARIVDQTRLPTELHYEDITTAEAMVDAIRRLAIRGAPAIGIAGAFGTVLGMRRSTAATPEAFDADVERATGLLVSARPTGVNLSWAIERMRRVATAVRARPLDDARAALLAEARAILEADREVCRRLGEHGAPLVPEGRTVLTHCNAGGLATAEFGTALAVFYTAHARGTRFRVFVDETRPLLQGSRLTAWELQHAGIDTTLICDSVAGLVMRDHDLGAVFVGADRIAANGDTANKVGTYSVSVLARVHGIPFYVVAPTSTFDLSIADGAGIPIEERAPAEVTNGFGTRTAPEGVDVFNPAFDVTPHENVTAIVTEFGVIERPDAARVRAFFERHVTGA